MNIGRVLVALVAAGGLLLAGCGDDDDADGAAPATGRGGAFPVTVTHAQGSVTIPERPERVVTLGFADTQIARALGANIVAAAENPISGDKNWPGVVPPLASDVTVIPSIEPNLELIASFDPDLILATTAQPAFGEAYDKLSEIAPVISYRKALLEDSGTELVDIIGRALGAEEKAAELLQSSDEAVADFATAHPELAGKKIAFGQYASPSTYVVVADNAPLTVFFTALGMQLSPELAALPVQQAPGITEIAGENLGLLDSLDILLLGTSDGGPGEFTSQPVAANLALVKENRLRAFDYDTASLLLAPNPAVTGAILDLLERLLGPTGG